MKRRHLIPFLLVFGVLSCGKDVIDNKDVKPFSGEVDFTADVIARIDITTDGGMPVNSKDPADYRPCTVKVSGSEDYAMEERGKIRGRGNSTWNWYPKKPYRIKLDASVPFLGMAPNKDWVLLADYRGQHLYEPPRNHPSSPYIPERKEDIEPPSSQYNYG